MEPSYLVKLIQLIPLAETLTISGQGSIALPSVGTNKSITLNTLGITDGTSGTIGLASNYTLDSGTFDITAKSITLSGSRQYDGTTNVVSSDLSLIGEIRRVYINHWNRLCN